MRRRDRDQRVGAGVEHADGDDEWQQAPRDARDGSGPGEGEHENGDRAEARGRGAAQGALSCAASPRPTTKSPKPSAATSASPTPAATACPPRPPGSRETSTIPARASAMPAHWTAAGDVAAGHRDGEWHDRRGRRDRAPRSPSRRSPCRDRGNRGRRRPRRPLRRRTGCRRRAGRQPLATIQTASPARPTSCDQKRTISTFRRRVARPPKKSPVPQSAAAASARTTAVIEPAPYSPTGRVAAWASSWFAWYSTAASAVRAACRSWWTATACRSSARTSGVQARRPLLDQAQPEMDVAEQAPLLGLAEGRAAPELDRAADVVQERRGEQEVAAQPWMQLRRLATQRRDADRVLEQPAGVAVVTVGAGGGKGAERRPDRRRRRGCPRPGRRGPGARSRRRGSRGSRRARRRRDASPASGRRDRSRAPTSTARTCTCSLPPNRSTRPSTRTASPSAKRPSSSSTSSQTRASIRPLASTSSSARYGRPGLRPPALLAPDGVDALDGAVLRELGDAGHAGSLGGRGGTLGPWPMSPRSARSATRSPRPPSRRRRTTCSPPSCVTSTVPAIPTTSST